MTMTELTAHLKIFAKGVGADIQKLITKADAAAATANAAVSAVAAKLDISTFGTWVTSTLPGLIAGHPIVSDLKAKDTAATSATVDMIAEANSQITDTTFKLPNS